MFASPKFDGEVSRTLLKVPSNSTTFRKGVQRRNYAQQFVESICLIAHTFGTKIGLARSVARATGVTTTLL